MPGRSAAFWAVGVAFGLVAAPMPLLAAPPAETEVATEETADPAASTDPTAATPPAPGGSGAKAAVLPLVVEGGELSEGDRQSLTGGLVDGLQRGAFAVVAPDQVMAASSNADKCDKPRCFKSIAADTGATHVVRVVITVKDRDYRVDVALVDASTGETMATSSEGCEICGVADVGGLISTAAATLKTKLDALASGPSTLVLHSDPAGATVTIDGEIAGVTPLERPVIPGKHVVRVSKDGFIALERELTFVEGVQEKAEFSLDKLPSRLPGRTWGWASLGVGVAGIGGGLFLTYLHDVPYTVKCSGGNQDMDGDCRYLWNTKWAAVGTIAAGAALTTLGVAILLSTTPKRARKDKANARIGVGPGSVLVHGRF